MTCPNCGHDVPRAPFCVRCGEPLENQTSPYPVEGRGYAASPAERWFAPRIVSSIFPHLPRSDMQAFRVALLFSSALIVVLSSFNLFPLALVLAAALVPFLTVLYLWDVDLYEDEPLPMLAFTIAWGAVAGVAIGFAASHLASPISLLAGKASPHNVLWLGILLPLASVVLMLLGPLVLLPYRRFNDVLDGVTFGGACAVTLLGAEAITNSANFLGSGLTAAGDEALWIARLLTLGIALPVLAASAIGAACGALWLRYRAPAHDRSALGLLGSPLVALPLAAAAIVGAYLSAIYLGQWAALAITSALAAAALLALRRVIHLGLLQEAAETEIGPPIRCPNCGRETLAHTFCAQCGVALRALPKRGAAGTPLQQPAPPRVPRSLLLTAFGGLIAASLALSVLVIVLVRPAPVQPPCSPGRPCGTPPHGPPSPAPRRGANAAGSGLETGRAWVSAVGVRLRYDPKWWKSPSVTQVHLLLEHKEGGVLVTAFVIAVPSTVGPEQLLDDQLAKERQGYLGLERDNVEAHVLLRPEVGFVHGIGAMYKATADQPPSPSRRVELAFQVATFGAATVLVEAVTDEIPQTTSKGATSPFPAYFDVDRLLDTFQWVHPA